MDLVEKVWTSVNSQSSIDADVIDESMFCLSCHEDTNGVELPCVSYEYDLPLFQIVDGNLTKMKEVAKLTLSSDDTFSYQVDDESFIDITDDCHWIVLKRWVSSTIYQEIIIPCFPRINLSEHGIYVQEFFKGKPMLDDRVYKIKENLEYDRVVGYMPVRIDNYEEE